MTQLQILVVDDDAISLDIMTQLLKHYDFEVDVVASGVAALDRLHVKQYDVALIDLAMPDMDGWQLLQAIQANPATTALKSFAVTAHYHPGLAFKARQAG
ncbi:MAG: response regulator, partial [Armatimonadetes bacterium]|nr:response regulator [Anaerolineae bacterium]